MNSASNIISRLNAFGLVLLAALMTASCAGDSIEGGMSSDPDAGYLTLSLSSSSLGSRADEADVDALNENLIDHALVCLFPVADENATPVFMQDVTINTRTEADVKLRINRDLINQLFPDETNLTAHAYVIANLPATTVIPENPTLGQLKSLQIESDFASKTVRPSFVMDGIDKIKLERDPVDLAKSKISGEIHLTRSAAKINLAVKFADEVTDAYGNIWIPVTTGAGMSALINNGVRRSAVTPATYTLTEADYYSTSTKADNPNNTGRSLELDNTSAEYPYTLSKSPFYTYPNSWTSEDDNMTYLTLIVLWTLKDDPTTFRTCYYMVPVLRDEFALIRNVSYKVNINIAILGSFTPDDPLKLEDVSYRAVDWSKEQIGVEINDYRYLVLDQTSYTVNNEALANISFYSSHETVIKSTEVKYYLYNTTAAGLEDSVTITSAQNQRSTSTTLVPDSTIHIYSSWIDNTIDQQTASRSLYLNHPLYQWTPYTSTGAVVTLGAEEAGGTTYPTSTLQTRVNQISYYVPTNNSAYSRYEITMVIVHKDKLNTPEEALYSETVHIVQYPAMYIEAITNNYRTVTVTTQQGNRYTNSTQLTAPASFGSVYINGTTNDSSTGGGAQMTPSGLTGGNRNPNMYILTLTQLDNNDKRYIIGDPRTATISNPTYETNGQNQWTDAKTVDGGTERKLLYYYPTDTSDDKKFYIAPKLRVASSFGVSSTYDKTVATRRCAGYQEMDCPGGRWRLPTYAEVEYIINLSNTGKIPVLFSATSNYWTAQGPISGKVDGEGHLTIVNETTAHIRCVYDEWYWGDSKVQAEGTVEWSHRYRPNANQNNWQTDTYTAPLYPFRWGDEQRK